MLFNFYSSSLNQVTKGFAKGLFVIGLLLIGFGILVWIFKEILAIIAAAIFMAVGVICCFNAVRVFIGTMKSGRHSGDERDNVRIRIEDNSEF
ncbi:MAG: hypothetical protein CVV39_06240 [Planctomycetes bacterium HGW-Planctomycetes-1]|nr:MAG: hypothetical protein CVV39_06240 [Planctomycetes bacterium HGW-Planctomycetes-1]